MQLNWDESILKEFKSRRPYDDDQPDGYQESDRDYVNNNFDLCVWMLDQLEFIKQQTIERSNQQ